VLVSVTADVENSIRQEKSIDFDPTKVASKEAEITTDTKEETTSSGASREPGAVPNAALTIADGSSGGGGMSSQSTSETSRTRMDNRFSEKHTETMTPAGKPKPIAASVRVPRSYFVSVWKSLNPASSQEPTDAEMAEMVRAQLDSIREDVVRCMGVIGTDAIVVQTYNDLKPMYAAGVGVVGTGSASGGVTTTLTSHAREIVIGALAVVSLFMVMMLVRKSSPTASLSIPTVSTAPPVEIGPAETIVGVVGGEGGQLDGIEVDDDAIRAQQMVEQVQTLVKENPEVAANLLKRWLIRD
jgi:flagellar biosynthesis/type III secretory pathway M-ring protein FliF/YscJ